MIERSHPTKLKPLSLPLGESIKAVLFDVDGTLYNQRRVRLAMAFQLAVWLLAHPRKGPTVVRVIQKFRAAQERLRNQNLTYNQAIRSLQDEQLQAAAAACGFDVDTTRSIIREWIFQRPLAPIRKHGHPELYDILYQLRKKGMKLGVFSDYPAEKKLEALGIAPCFDVVVSSYDPAVARFKPHPQGFLTTLERLKVSPAEAVYVGDREEVDGAGARAAGMHAIIIEPRLPAGYPDRYLYVGSLRQLLDESDKHE